MQLTREKFSEHERGSLMKFTALRFVLIGIFALGLCGSVFAQTERDKPTDNDKTAGKEMSVTGCLQKGDQANEYSITAADGKTYGLRSTSVNLSNHLNHKVTVTGKTMKQENAKEGREGEGRQGKEEQEHLNVTNLKMVSTSCQ